MERHNLKQENNTFRRLTLHLMDKTQPFMDMIKLCYRIDRLLFYLFQFTLFTQMDIVQITDNPVDLSFFVIGDAGKK